MADEIDNITVNRNYHESPYRSYKKDEKIIIQIIYPYIKEISLKVIHKSV